MGKPVRQSGKMSARVETPRRATERNRSLQIGLVAGLATVLVAAVVVGALVVTGAFATGGSNSVPAGTETFPEPDHAHVSGTVSYDRVPPAGGPHNAIPLNCGVYTQPVPNENAVHSLEHGAVWITYQPTLSADQVARLQQLVTSNYVGTDRYLIMSPYIGLPSPIVASAWGAQLRVDQASDNRLTDFVHAYAGSGQGGEPGSPCTGGLGNPVK